jgi:hypothetical protein
MIWICDNEFKWENEVSLKCYFFISKKISRDNYAVELDNLNYFRNNFINSNLLNVLK